MSGRDTLATLITHPSKHTSLQGACHDIPPTHCPPLPYPKLSSKDFMGLVGVSDTIQKGPLSTRLAELVFFRVSQINGCINAGMRSPIPETPLA